MSISKAKATYIINQLEKIGVKEKSQVKAIAILICDENIMTCQRLKAKFNNGAILDKISYEIQGIEWTKDFIRKM